MKIKKIHVLGIIASLVTILISLVFLNDKDLFYFLLGIGVIVGVLPFVVTIIIETEKEKEKEGMFLEFSRNLVESVKAGTPISKSIINVKGKNYGSLTVHVDKLCNQIALGIPVKDALEVFARDLDNKTISRAITLISEADQAGGEIGVILENVAKSVSQTDKLKKERKASIYTFVVQGYIIFFIFIVIMLVMEFKILPMLTNFQGVQQTGSGSSAAGLSFVSGCSSSNKAISPEELSRPFLYLLLVQGFFVGLTVGKLAEGSIKAGIKHSFVLVCMAWIISTGAKVLYG
jgi:archaeal flagellar protein FlaJ